MQSDFEQKTATFQKALEESVDFTAQKASEETKLQNRNIKLSAKLQKTKTIKEKLKDSLSKLEEN